MLTSSLLQVPHYMAAQYLGSLTASLTVFLAYWDSLVWYEHDRGEYRSVRGDPGVRCHQLVVRSVPDTARIFATYPAPHLSWLGGLMDQFIGTAVFLLCICAITDNRQVPSVSSQVTRSWRRRQ